MKDWKYIIRLYAKLGSQDKIEIKLIAGVIIFKNLL